MTDLIKKIHNRPFFFLYYTALFSNYQNTESALNEYPFKIYKISIEFIFTKCYIMNVKAEWIFSRRID